MSIITWNCQGALDKKFPSVFKTLVANYKPEIFVLVEPRISGSKADKVIQKLRFSHSHRVEAHGFSGGIWVLWSNNVQVTVLHCHFQFIHMKVVYLESNLSFHFTAVYGSPHAQYRRLLWSDLTLHSPPPSSPWLLAGDFNATTAPEDRCGGASRRNHGCPAFKSFINHSGLIDLGFSGSRFTWRRGATFVRLDRALATSSWLTLFSHSRVTHLPMVLSDHRPILLSLGIHARIAPREKPFKFLAAWLTHPSFKDLVRATWLPGDSIPSNIRRFTSAAMAWNSEVFGSIGLRKKRTCARLQGAQRSLEDQPHSDFLLRLEQSLREDFETTCF